MISKIKMMITKFILEINHPDSSAKFQRYNKPHIVMFWVLKTHNNCLEI